MIKQRYFLIIAVLVLISWIPKKTDRITVWMIGDSTMCMYDSSRAPVTGWGMPFAGFFDSSVVIKNEARGGRSTRTFISENRWKPIVDHLKEGDYVIIQFGHNDEAKEERYKDRYTPVPDYILNLKKFISESRDKNAIPVLVTPVSRMRFDKQGNAQPTHVEYTAAVWQVGKELAVPVIDLDARSRGVMQEMGAANAPLLFMQLQPGEHPHYPEGQKDNTHFNEYGARIMAELVLADMKKIELPLTDRVIRKNR